MATTNHVLFDTRNNRLHTAVFSWGGNHPCAEDHDGPVMLIKHMAHGRVVSERLVLVEEAREEWKRLCAEGYRPKG